MSACRGVFVLCNSKWRTYVVSGLRNIEVYAIQGCNKCIVNVSFLGPRDSVLFIEVSVFQESAFGDSSNTLLLQMYD